MSWSHLRATLWLRWRILVNRIKRTGKLGNVLFGIVLVLGLALCLGLFLLALMVGVETLPQAEPLPLMLVWGGLGLLFLFAWMIGLVTDLQRSDAMSFKNLLHLPVSLGWVFLYNYLSSFVSLAVALFLPAMLGVCVAMVVVHGPRMLVSFPLLAGFFCMVTAITYQLRGWLARLMEDKRRGRNIVALITVSFVLLAQAPNLINLGLHRSSREDDRLESELDDLRQVAHEEGPEQAAARVELARLEQEHLLREATLEQNISLGALLVPVGWLPYGVRAAFEGRWLAEVLCALGMLSIGAWSLSRSYRTTMLSSVGGGSSGSGAVVEPAREVAASDGRGTPRATRLVERRLPFAREGVACIALAGLRSLLRAPEAKMMLLSPVILLAFFGLMLSKETTRDALGAFAPMMGFGAVAMALLSIIQLLQNQFGLDRAGFRAYVLCPVPRDQILLGKNLATAPLGIGIGVIALALLQVLMPSDPSHFVGSLLQLVSAYLLLCLVGNMMSIFGPMRLKDHGLKAANAKFKVILWQVLSVLLIPVTLSPLLIPSGVELLLGREDWARAVPLYALLHALEAVGVFLFYRWLIRRQGELLWGREQRILDVLTHD